jgi:hypothetical protein
MHEQLAKHEISWHKFDIHRSSLAATGKSQARFVAVLLAVLALLWGSHYVPPAELKIEFMGATFQAPGLWRIAPAVLTILVLAVIGSMNIMGPIWKRLDDCGSSLGERFVWTDLDPNKTLIDFFTYLKIWPEGPLEPYILENAEPIHRFSVFSYPALLTFATVTTMRAANATPGLLYRSYVYGCVASQILFSLRIWYRAVCRFFGVRKTQTQI